MAEIKTKLNDASVEDFLNKIEDETKRKDAFELLSIMKRATGEEPKMWGDSIIGFGKYRYTYASGQQGDWLITGFSPRKQNLTVYIISGFSRCEDLMSKLGKYKTSKSCLYIKKLADVDAKKLEELVKQSVKYMKEKYREVK